MREWLSNSNRSNSIRTHSIIRYRTINMDKTSILKRKIPIAKPNNFIRTLSFWKMERFKWGSNQITMKKTLISTRFSSSRIGSMFRRDINCFFLLVRVFIINSHVFIFMNLNKVLEATVLSQRLMIKFNRIKLPSKKYSRLSFIMDEIQELFHSFPFYLNNHLVLHAIIYIFILFK